jgi:hypothetical protein
MVAARILIELLHSHGCLSLPPARQLVEKLAREMACPVEIREVLVSTPEEAQSLKFPGSTTIRINGRDLEPEVACRSDYGLG